MPTKSQAQRDLEALGSLARASLEQTNLSLASFPAAQVNQARGPLAAAIFEAMLKGYLEDREGYAEPQPDIPPTPVPKTSI